MEEEEEEAEEAAAATAAAVARDTLKSLMLEVMEERPSCEDECCDRKES